MYGHRGPSARSRSIDERSELSQQRGICAQTWVLLWHLTNGCDCIGK